MVLTPSTMLALGTTAPDFSLPDAKGTIHTLESIAQGKQATLVAFLCNHCPYVKHLKTEFAALVKTYQERGLAAVAINSNGIDNYPDDSPEKMLQDSADFGYTFPYLIDADQATAKAYRAACTPDFYIFDAALQLAYRGQFDDSRPDSGKPVTGMDLRKALDTLLAGETVDSDQKASIGCNIKWKPGNEPDYFG